MIAEQRRDPRSQCDGKRQHHVWEVAVVEAHRRHADEYLCPHCGYWHVGRRDGLVAALIQEMFYTYFTSEAFTAPRGDR